MDCISLRPRPVYIRVQDLGCKATTPDMYGSPDTISKLSNIL